MLHCDNVYPKGFRVWTAIFNMIRIQHASPPQQAPFFTSGLRATAILTATVIPLAAVLRGMRSSVDRVQTGFLLVSRCSSLQSSAVQNPSYGLL